MFYFLGEYINGGNRLDGKQGSEFWFTLPITLEKNKTIERYL